MQPLPPPRPTLPGVSLGPILGRGGMSVVYAARHEATGSAVAVKVLTRSVDAARLRVEARAMAQLSHRCILPVLDVGETDGRPWLILARAPSVLAEVALEAAAWRRVVRGVLSALAHAHARGVLHLDVKPSNVLLGADGGPLLADFGVSRVMGDAAFSLAASPAFAAPEQLAGQLESLGPWTDLYAVGALAYTLARGRRPFSAEDRVRTVPHLPGAPASLQAFVARLLQPHPQDRFRCAADALHALGGLELGASASLGSLVDPRPPAQTQTLTIAAPGGRWAVASGPALGLTPRRPPPPPDRPPAVDVHPSPADALGLGLYDHRTVPFVGRSVVYERLWRALLAVGQGGRSQGCILRGPHGIGRTRLVEQLRAVAHETGAAWTFAPPPGVEPCTALSERHGVRGLQGGPAAAEWLVAEAASGGRPWLVVLDDLHAAGPRLELLRRLVDRQAPVLWVVTVRDGAADDEVETVLAGLTPPIALGPLPALDQRRLVEGLLPLDAGLAEAIGQRTGGNPMFAVQLVRDWVQRGLLIRGAEGRWGVTDADVPLPDDLYSVWADRIEALVEAAPMDAAPALELAAVLGTPLRRPEWEALVGPKLVEALVEMLLARGMIEEGGAILRWTHAVLPDALLRRARDGGRLVAHHGRCVQMLAPVEQPEARWRRGEHAWAAGQREEALDDLLVGARVLQQGRWFGRADALLDRIQPILDRRADPAQQAMALAIRGFTHHLAGRPQVGSACVERALQRLPDPADVDVFYILRVAHDVRRTLGDETRDLARRMVQTASDQPLFRQLVAQAAIVGAEPEGPDREAAAAALGRLVDTPSVPDARLGIALNTASSRLRAMGRTTEARRALLRAAELLAHRPGLRADSFNQLGLLEREVGDLTASDACFERSLSAMRLGGGRGGGLIHLNLAVNALLDRDPERAGPHLVRATDLPDNFAAAVQALHLWRAIERGAREESAEILERAAAVPGRWVSGVDHAWGQAQDRALELGWTALAARIAEVRATRAP